MEKTNRLKKKYEEQVTKKLAEEFAIKNRMAIPKLTKIIVNMGIGDLIKNKEAVEQAKKDMAAITGQKPSQRAAKVSVASFGIRRGMKVGLKVTIRGDRMYAFLDRLFSVVLPRLRDFRGVSRRKFDKHGNYTLGISEYTVFPEVDVTKSSPHGLEVSIVTNANDVEKSARLLELLGMPFEKEE